MQGIRWALWIDVGARSVGYCSHGTKRNDGGADVTPASSWVPGYSLHQEELIPVLLYCIRHGFHTGFKGAVHFGKELVFSPMRFR